MANIRGSNQSPIVTQRYLNTSSYAGDPGPGTVVQTSDVSGSIVQPYTGQLGGILTLGEVSANYYSDPTYGQQLYAGDYQYVHFYASSSASAAVQGQVVFWLDSTTNLLSGSWDVTPDYSAARGGEVAGIALCNTAKGKYWFIQIAGVAQVKFASALGASTPAVGDLVFVDYSGGTKYAYDPDQTLTGLTIAQWKHKLGTAFATAPAVSTVSPVLLGPNPKYYPGS